MVAHGTGAEHIAFPNLVVQGAEVKDESLWLNIDNAKKSTKRQALWHVN